MTFIKKIMTHKRACLLEIETGLYKFFLQATLRLIHKLASKIWRHFVKNLQRCDTISAHVPKRTLQFASEKLQYTGMNFI